MTLSPVGVGIIGASSQRGWASLTHLPILDALDDFELVAVATTNKESAEATASRYAVPHAYTDPRDLVADPRVELVVVSVRVDHHAELVRMAIDAGKHVWCEWPLVTNTADAEALLARAQLQGIHHVIDLQATVAPAIQHARDLLADGYIGAVESVMVQAALPYGGPTVNAANRYMLDRATGGSILLVATAHMLAGVAAMLGDITSVSATLRTRFEQVTVVDTGELIASQVPDHVAISAEIGDGVVLIADVHGGHPRQPHTTVDILGSDGVLRLETRPHPPRERLGRRRPEPPGVAGK